METRYHDKNGAHLKSHKSKELIKEKMKTKILLFVLFTIFINISLIAQPGSLDNSFGTGGIVTTQIGTVSGSVDDGYSVAIQSDGKIVVAGSTWDDNTTNFAIARYNTDGSLDNTFGFGGKVNTNIGGNATGRYIIIQNDGKIVVAGYHYNGSNQDFVLARYNIDGSLDNTFGSSGIVITDFGFFDYCYSIAMQSDGKIVAAGQSNDNIALARYNIDGSLDNTFGSGGKVTKDLGGSDGAYSIAIQSDNKSVIACSSSIYAGSVFMRYTNTGILDNTFGSGGVVIENDGGASDVVIQSDGKIVAAGSSNYDFFLVRFNEGGNLDNTFGSGGKVTTSFGQDEVATALAIQSNGKIVAVGTHEENAYLYNHDFALARYNIDGSLDNTFGSSGKVITPLDPFSTTDDFACSVAIQNDWKIIVAGYNLSYTGSYNDHFVVVRYNNYGLGVNEKNAYLIDGIIYPNPSAGQFTIKIEDNLNKIMKYEFVIFNNLNQIIHRQTLTSKQEMINLNLPSGVYFYRINNEINDLNINGKLVIQ